MLTHRPDVVIALPSRRARREINPAVKLARAIVDHSVPDMSEAEHRRPDRLLLPEVERWMAEQRRS